jgi:hypothetical protein
MIDDMIVPFGSLEVFRKMIVPFGYYHAPLYAYQEASYTVSISKLKKTGDVF